MMILTKGGRLADWQEAFMKAPEGALVGDWIVLLPFQRQLLYEIYNPKQAGGHITLADEEKLFASLLTERDREALPRELVRCRAMSPARSRQLDKKLLQQSALRVGAFAAFVCQHTALELKLTEVPPCYVAHPDTTERGERYGGRLLRRIADARVSKFDSRAVAALAKNGRALR
jgi:hypothetical protein